MIILEKLQLNRRNKNHYLRTKGRYNGKGPGKIERATNGPRRFTSSTVCLSSLSSARETFSCWRRRREIETEDRSWVWNREIPSRNCRESVVTVVRTLLKTPLIPQTRIFFFCVGFLCFCRLERERNVIVVSNFKWFIEWFVVVVGWIVDVLVAINAQSHKSFRNRSQQLNGL